MFRTKVEVDRHVESRLKNIKNETERNVRCFSFAKLYFQVGDYEQTLRYISNYLITKPQSAEGLNLLGKVLEKQGKLEAALEVYRKSLQVDSKQNSIVVKVCELLGKEEVGLDVPRARYYYEQAQMLAPQNPAVFALKERLVSVESNNPNDVAKLLLSELDNRPTDIQLRIRLVRHFLHNNQIKEAYKHVADIEKRSLTIFLINLSWYETISEVLFRYQRENMNESNLAWEFWILLISVLDKLAALTLDEHINVNRAGPECVTVVFNLDQTLEIATKHLEICNERTLVQEFLNHYKAQLCLHFATLLFKQAKRDFIKYKDAMNMALPLLFIAYHTEPADLQSLWLDHTKEEYKQHVERWHKEAAFRCSQSGHILTAIAKESKRMIVDRATQNSSGLWREKLFKTLFVTRDQQSKINASYFVSCSSFTDITLNLPYLNDLIKYDEVAQAMYPGSIHNLVWICLNLNFASFRCTMFNGLPYSTKNLNFCSAESINILDIEAFLYCTTLTAKKQFEDMKQQVYYNSEKPQVLPLAVSDQVVTSAQSKWFTSAYKVYLKEYSGEMSELRLNLSRGIEVVRCVGNHGLDIKMLIILANTFAERAKSLKKESEIEFNEARAELYWKAALPLLEKMQKNQALGVCRNRLFEYKSKEMGSNEIVSYIDDGKLFIATQLMKHKEFEKAIGILNGLKSPYASFHQAQIYKTMANEQTNLNKENVTSEMRSQHIILLSRARDCFYLTLDRLRDPTVGGKHPLNQELGSEIEKIERMLCRIDPDMYGHRNEFNGNSADNTSSDGSMADNVNMYSSTILGNGFSTTSNYENRTPNITKHQWECRESRPSPERLDAQFRQMQASCNSTITQILEQNRMVVETQRTMVEELKNWKGSVNDDLRGIKDSINGLKGVVDELQSFRDMNDSIQQLKKEVAELKKAKPPALTEEELYALEEECGGDYGLTPNLSAYPNNLYPNLPPRMPTAGALPFTHPALYPNLYPNLYYPGLGVPQAGTLPFNQDSHLQDLRNLGSLSQNFAQAPPPMQMNQWEAGLFQSGLNQFGAGRTGQLGLVVPPQSAPTEQYSSPLVVASSASQLPIPPAVHVPSSKAPPVNVVITNSDPLPNMSSVQTSQVFSVTIPPQHLQGGTTSKSQPHNYQIPLPPVTSSRLTLTNSPSIVSQPPLIVSTQELLSNISPPKYSAVDTTPSKGVGLGLQIEKSLSQCFNTSGISDVSSVDEHDPCPDFKPIVPLPDEVPVNTGEEDETVLLSLRAKLYRFVQQDWKERGVGYLKILKNATTGKTRILMRRDQVHKICANHFITRDIVLIPMPNNPKAYSWAAHDFADEEIVIEKFSARFKNEQEAESFRVAFEKAKECAPEPTPEKPKPEPSSTSTLGGFKFTGTPTFKPKEQEIPKAISPKDIKTTGPFASFSFDAKNSTNIFSTPEAKSTPKLDKFAFGAANLFSTPVSSATATKNENFVFSNVSTTTNMFSTPISSSEVKIKDKSDGSPAAPEEYEPNVEFKPVIPLPELVEVKTGEENAEVLFESRAKILRYDSETKQWKERGIGIMKILKEENTIRLLMRREQVLKICCNHRLLKNVQFNKMKNSPNALSWCAQDFSEGVLVSEMFAIKFKTEEILNAFHTAIISAQRSLDDNNYVNSSSIVDDSKDEEIVKRDKKVKACPVEKVTPDHTKEKLKSKLTSWECKNCYNVNNSKSNLCDGCETQKSGSVKHQTLQDPMISTCNESVFSFVNNAVTITPIKASEKPKSSWGDAYKPKAGSWSCNICMVSNDVDKLYCVACDNPKNDTVPKKDATAPKGINLETSSGAKFTFGIVNQPQSKPISVEVSTGSSMWGEAFKPKAGSWECTQCLVRNDSEKSHCVSCDHPKDNSVTKKEAQPKGISLQTSGPKLTFGISPASKPNTQSSLWDSFKPKVGSWECNQCLLRNDADKLYCVSCENPKDDSVPKKEPKKGINLDTPVKFNFGISQSTESSSPASLNRDDSMPLHYAITNSGTNTSTNIKSPFTLPTMSTFSFNAPQISDKEAKSFGFIEPPAAKKDEEKFVFGSPQKHDFEFTPRSPRRQSSGGKGEDDSELYLEEEEDQIYFKPVIPLPDKIDVKTGEESEEVLYCHRARLYRFVEGDWKERGTGDIKILLSAQSSKLRVVMRRDQVLKICLNHYLTPSVEYLIKDEKSWLFSVMDYSEGEYNHWQFCLRFKTAEIAQGFKKAVDDAFNRISNQDEVPQVEGEDDNSDVEFVSETQVTPEEEQEALKLKLPPKFMSYRKLPDCTCATCKEDDKILQELLKPPAKQPSGIFDTTSCLFGTPCKPSAVDSGDIKSKFIFGKPFSSFSQSSTTPVKPPTESLLKDMLVKPSILETFNKTPESTSVAPIVTATPTAPSNKFSFIPEPKTPTTNLFSLPTPASTSSGTFSPAPATNIFSQTPTSSVFSQLSTNENIFSQKPVTPSGSLFANTNTLFNKATDTPKTGNLFANIASNIFGTTATSTPSSTGNLFVTTTSTPQVSIFGGNATQNKAEVKPLFGHTAPAFEASASLASLAAKYKNNPEPAPEIVFKCDSEVTFASLAAATPEKPAFGNAGDDLKPFSFLGAGAPVFASSKAGAKAEKKQDDDESETVAGAEEYDPHYEPIVPLPDAIVVTTGEEDEVPIFNERAKLYRYDIDNKEWKERGVGQLKILHHPVKGTYRLILRREQVHKVVLNMLISPALDLQPMATSDKAWLWGGYNYSGDEASLEKLAARFKNCELAQQFYSQVQVAVAAVKEQQNTSVPATVEEYVGPIISEVHEEDDDEGDEDDDEDDRSVLFMKSCTLSEQSNNAWIEVGEGDIQIYYDPELYGCRIAVNDHEGQLYSNTLIAVNTEMTLQGNECIWKAIEWTQNIPDWRVLKATFEDVESAQDFHVNYLESVHYAAEADIVDGVVAEQYDDEEN